MNTLDTIRFILRTEKVHDLRFLLKDLEWLVQERSLSMDNFSNLVSNSTKRTDISFYCLLKFTQSVFFRILYHYECLSGVFYLFMRDVITVEIL